MSDSVIWILTADDWNAQIHVSQDGNSTLLHSVRNRMPERIASRDMRDSADFDELQNVLGLHTARPRNTHLCFAHELLWLLGEHTGEYDGLVVMATPDMLEALGCIHAPLIRGRVIAEIVMAAPIGNPIMETGTSPAQAPLRLTV